METRQPVTDTVTAPTIPHGRPRAKGQGFQRSRSSVSALKWPPEPKVTGSNPVGRMGQGPGVSPGPCFMCLPWESDPLVRAESRRSRARPAERSAAHPVGRIGPGLGVSPGPCSMCLPWESDPLVRAESRRFAAALELANLWPDRVSSLEESMIQLAHHVGISARWRCEQSQRPTG